jgi:hypothetical protein
LRLNLVLMKYTEVVLYLFNLIDVFKIGTQNKLLTTYLICFYLCVGLWYYITHGQDAKKVRRTLAVLKIKRRLFDDTRDRD